MNATLTPGTTAQLLAYGIPARQHDYESLRRLIPPFDGVHHEKDVQVLAEIVLYLAKHRILAAEADSRTAEQIGLMLGGSPRALGEIAVSGE